LSAIVVAANLDAILQPPQLAVGADDDLFLFTLSEDLAKTMLDISRRPDIVHFSTFMFSPPFRFAGLRKHWQSC
jgi:hypothetical protein